MKLLWCLFTILFLVCAPSQAQGTCSTHTTRGDWGVTCGGNLTPGPNAPLTPVEILGTCAADADGLFTCEATMSLAGTILPQTMVGKAIVRGNCTGTIRYVQTVGGAPAPDLNIRFLILDGGKLIKGLPVDPGSNMSCTLTKM